MLLNMFYYLVLGCVSSRVIQQYELIVRFRSVELNILTVARPFAVSDPFANVIRPFVISHRIESAIVVLYVPPLYQSDRWCFEQF